MIGWITYRHHRGRGSSRNSIEMEANLTFCSFWCLTDRRAPKKMGNMAMMIRLPYATAEPSSDAGVFLVPVNVSVAFSTACWTTFSTVSAMLLSYGWWIRSYTQLICQWKTIFWITLIDARCIFLCWLLYHRSKHDWMRCNNAETDQNLSEYTRRRYIMTEPIVLIENVRNTDHES